MREPICTRLRVLRKKVKAATWIGLSYPRRLSRYSTEFLRLPHIGEFLIRSCRIRLKPESLPVPDTTSKRSVKGLAKQGLIDDEILSKGFECFEALYTQFKRS
jgi:hypothetical protein